MYRREFDRYDFLLTLFERGGKWWAQGSGPELGQQESPLDLERLSEAVRRHGGFPALLDRLAELGHEIHPQSPDRLSDPERDREIGRFLFDAAVVGPVRDLFAQWLPTASYLPRLVLRIEVPELAVLLWELLRNSEGEPLRTSADNLIAIVRSVAETPAVAAQPLTVPLRVVQFDVVWGRGPAHAAQSEVAVDVREAVADVFRSATTGLPHVEMESVMHVDRRSISDGDELRGLRDKLVVDKKPQDQMDIVHFSRVRVRPDLHNLGLLLPPAGTSTARDMETILRMLGVEETRSPPSGKPFFFSLGDLVTFLHLAETRLLVLQVDWHDPDTQQGCLLLAQALASRGGPPVLVSRFPYQSHGAHEFYRAFYDRLIHDDPLDVAVQQAEQATDQTGQTGLITGPKGEDLLRLSALLPHTYRLRDEAQARLQQVMNVSEWMEGRVARSLSEDHPTRQELSARRQSLRSAKDRMKVLAGEWPLFWDHESTSSIPLVENLSRVNDVLASVEDAEKWLESVANTVAEEEAIRRRELEVEPRPREDRHVNTWLAYPLNGRRVPETQHLWAHKTYHLRVDIGPHADQSTVLNPAPIPDAALEPLYQKGGDWVQVAVYSQDFNLTHVRDVHHTGGEHLQRPASVMRRLWLPATGGSQPIYFEIKPKRLGLAYLRICVYYRNQLLQSLRTDARVQIWKGDDIQQLPGIGPVRQAQLREIGMETLEDLVAATEEGKLQKVLDILGWDLTWESMDTAKALRETKAELDDNPLLEVPGIGSSEAQRLREAGILKFEDLAAADPHRVAAVAEVAPEIAREWVSTAGRLPNLGNETYVEYTTSADLHDVRQWPERAVGIFTNKLNGTHAIGVKVGEWDEVWGTEDDWTDATNIPQQGLSQRLTVIRRALDEIGTVKVGGNELYAFASQDRPDLTPPLRANQGTTEKLQEALKMLAIRGHALYNEIFSEEAKVRLASVLADPGQTIHIARVMEGEVLPWAALYDLYLDISEVPESVCLDLLKHVDSEGRLDYKACTGQAECPLKPDNRGRVVCPWGFWGIKHVLEQPPQRVAKEAQPRDLKTEIRVTGPANVSMNVSTRLEFLDAHRDRLSQMPGIRQPLSYAGDDRPQSGQPPQERGKDQVLKALESKDLHVIYFYCHGGATDEITGWLKPYLSVGGTERQWIVPENLSRLDPSNQPVYDWAEHPLVFINGCETAGLDPTLMGHFIQVFAEHGAAGIIGTEVPVWEPLATFFAEEFFDAFLKGQPVGRILRDLRHELLRRYNPLGLIYTNYCSADLHLVKADNGAGGAAGDNS